MPSESKLPSVSATVTDALMNTLGSVGLSLLTLAMYVVLSTNIHSLVDQYLGGGGGGGDQQEDPMMEMYTSYIRPMMAINLLNASHIYHIALIIAIIAVITVVDGALGYVNAVVATQARIPLRLVASLNAETMDIAIANAGRTSLPTKK